MLETAARYSIFGGINLKPAPAHGRCPIVVFFRSTSLGMARPFPARTLVDRISRCKTRRRTHKRCTRISGDHKPTDGIEPSRRPVEPLLCNSDRQDHSGQVTCLLFRDKLRVLRVGRIAVLAVTLRSLVRMDMISPNGTLNLGIPSRMPFGIDGLHTYTFVIVSVNLLLRRSSRAGLRRAI
jgi:hypothetical protein